MSPLPFNPPLTVYLTLYFSLYVSPLLLFLSSALLSLQFLLSLNVFPSSFDHQVLKLTYHHTIPVQWNNLSGLGVMTGQADCKVIGFRPGKVEIQNCPNWHYTKAICIWYLIIKMKELHITWKAKKCNSSILFLYINAGTEAMTEV